MDGFLYIDIDIDMWIVITLVNLIIVIVSDVSWCAEVEFVVFIHFYNLLIQLLWSSDYLWASYSQNLLMIHFLQFV